MFYIYLQRDIAPIQQYLIVERIYSFISDESSFINDLKIYN